MRRMPSLATLEQIHDADHAAMRRILKMGRAELLATEAGRQRDAECHHAPSVEDIRMHCLNAAARTHGVECQKIRQDEFAEYLNTGEMYAPTLILWRGNFRVQSMGDFIESMERQGIYQTWNH